MSRAPFIHAVRVYWEDTDAGGVVYHAQYLAFLERARSEWLRARGVAQDRLRAEHDLVFAQAIHRDGALLLDAEVRVAALRASDFRPRPLPPELFDELASLETTPR